MSPVTVLVAASVAVITSVPAAVRVTWKTCSPLSAAVNWYDVGATVALAIAGADLDRARVARHAVVRGVERHDLDGCRLADVHLTWSEQAKVCHDLRRVDRHGHASGDGTGRGVGGGDRLASRRIERHWEEMNAVVARRESVIGGDRHAGSGVGRGEMDGAGVIASQVIGGVQRNNLQVCGGT